MLCLQQAEHESVGGKRQWFGGMPEIEETGVDCIITRSKRAADAVSAEPDAYSLSLGPPPVGVCIDETVHLDDKPGLLLDLSYCSGLDVFVPLDVSAWDTPCSGLRAIAALHEQHFALLNHGNGDADGWAAHVAVPAARALPA